MINQSVKVSLYVLGCLLISCLFANNSYAIEQQNKNKSSIQQTTLSQDSDNDGIPDDYENRHGLDPNNGDDAQVDNDGDGLSNLQEFLASTDPNNIDTDGDGIEDGDEVTYGLNPNIDDAFLDADLDGFANIHEVLVGSDVNVLSSIPPSIVSTTPQNDIFLIASDVTIDNVIGKVEFTKFNANGEVTHNTQLGRWEHTANYIKITGTGLISIAFKSIDVDGDGNPEQVETHSRVSDIYLFSDQGNQVKVLYQNEELYPNGELPKQITRHYDNLNTYAYSELQAFSSLVINNTYHMPLYDYETKSFLPGSLRITGSGSALYETVTGQHTVNWIQSDDKKHIRLTLPDSSNIDFYTFAPIEVGYKASILYSPSNTALNNGHFARTSNRAFINEEVVNVNVPLRIQLNGSSSFALSFFDNGVGQHESVFDQSTSSVPFAYALSEQNSKILARYYENESYQNVTDCSQETICRLVRKRHVKFLAKRSDYYYVSLVQEWDYQGDGIIDRRGGYLAIMYIRAEHDSDFDGLPDSYEDANGLDKYNASDAVLDADDDGLTNFQEYEAGTDPQNADSDDDGIVDAAELANGLNPNLDDAFQDADQDGYVNIHEILVGSNANAFSSIPSQVISTTPENDIFVIASDVTIDNQIGKVEFTKFNANGTVSHNSRTGNWAHTSQFLHVRDTGLMSVFFKSVDVDGDGTPEQVETHSGLADMYLFATETNQVKVLYQYETRYPNGELPTEIRRELYVNDLHTYSYNELNAFSGLVINNTYHMSLYDYQSRRFLPGSLHITGTTSALYKTVTGEQTVSWIQSSDNKHIQVTMADNSTVDIYSFASIEVGYKASILYSPSASAQTSGHQALTSNRAFIQEEIINVATPLRIQLNGSSTFALNFFNNGIGQHESVFDLSSTVVPFVYALSEQNSKILASYYENENYQNVTDCSQETVCRLVRKRHVKFLAKRDDYYYVNLVQEWDYQGDGIIDNRSGYFAIMYIRAEHDSDFDGIPDVYEDANGLNKYDASDVALDADNDGLTNLEEYQAGTDPNNEDSDGDGVRDGADTYPLNDKRWTDTDTDGDGVTDDVETLLGLDINSRLDVWQDADNDGRPLYYERLLNSDEQVKDNNLFDKSQDAYENMVRLAYLDTQYQLVDDNTLASLVSQLENDDTNIALLYSDLMTDYDVAQMGFIGRVYRAVMMRNADAGGAAHYRKRLNTGMSRLAMVTGFVNSGEFQNRYGSLSNGEFVELVYRNVMNRAADAGGYNYWVGRLDNNVTSRAELMLAFGESNEYINRIDMLERMRVFALLVTRYQYSDDELGAFVTRVLAEKSTYSMMRELLASDHFKTRVMAGLTPASNDTDGDGVIDGIEFIDGANPQIKDNDVDTDDTAFVKQSYRDLMTEQWSLSQVATDVASLSSMSRAQWLDSLMNSDAYVDSQTPVARLFFSAFLRRPDRNGLRFWQGKFDGGMKLKDIANVFAGSTEFQNRYGSLTDSEFIDLAYQNVLLRNVDAGGKQFWLNKLSNGTSRGEMLSGFSDSNEGKRKAQSKVNSVLLYNDLLQRDPTNGEYTSAKTQLDNNDREGLITTLLNMQEYSLRFN